MLLHAILLLGSLAAADFAPPCDTSLIRGVAAQEISIDFHNPSSQLRVRCASSSSLKAIKLHSGPDALHSNQFDSLTCDANDGWTAHTYSPSEKHHYRVTDASSPVNISCPFEYCVVEATNGTLVVRRTSDDISTLSVECPAGQELFEPELDSSVDYHKRTHVVAGSKLTCSLHNAWTRTDSTSFAANASKPMRRVECRDYSHCDPSLNPSLMKGISANKIEFSINTKGQRVWSCAHRDTHLSGMFSKIPNLANVRNERFDTLRCDQNGWSEYAVKGETKPRAYGVELPYYNVYSCFEYCAVISETGLYLHIDKQEPDDSIPHQQNDFNMVEVSCAEEAQKLYYNGHKLTRNYVGCRMWSGWENYDIENMTIDKSPFIQQRVECRNDSHGKRSSRAEGKQEE